MCEKLCRFIFSNKRSFQEGSGNQHFVKGWRFALSLKKKRGTESLICRWVSYSSLLYNNLLSPSFSTEKFSVLSQQFIQKARLCPRPRTPRTSPRVLNESSSVLLQPWCSVSSTETKRFFLLLINTRLTSLWVRRVSDILKSTTQHVKHPINQVKPVGSLDTKGRSKIDFRGDDGIGTQNGPNRTIRLEIWVVVLILRRAPQPESRRWRREGWEKEKTLIWEGMKLERKRFLRVVKYLL